MGFDSLLTRLALTPLWPSRPQVVELRSAEELCGARKFQSDGKSDMPLLLQCYSENLFARIDRGTSRVESTEADEAHFCIEKIRNSPIMEVY